MLTGRAWALLGAGAVLWVTSRLLGTPDLHMVAVGLLALVPLAMLLVRFLPTEVSAVRRLSTRRAFPGTRVEVEIEVRNTGRRSTAMLLVEDRVPPTLGPTARGVLGEIPPRGRRRITYQLTPPARGRYRVGPLAILIADPFDLARKRVQIDLVHDLVVFPEVESIGSGRAASPLGGTGEASTRQLFRAADEFYTMREYENGDDLRRIHWPSVARTGDLMIRQDEASHRAAATVFLDDRAAAVGGHGPAFERAVSAAASIGALYLRSGFRLRLATVERPPAVVELDRFLEALALARPVGSSQLAPALSRVAAAAGIDGALVVVTGIPDPAATSTLTRVGTGVARKVVVLVLPQEPDHLTIGARHTLERSVEAARDALTRAGWEAIALGPSERLGDAWPRTTRRHLVRSS